jgi:hypothetical protein
VLLVVRNEVLKVFQIDKFANQPKTNPWSKNAFTDLIYKVYPELLKRAGYKLKEKLFQSIKVNVVPKEIIIAHEKHLLKSTCLLTVVEGSLRFFKRDSELNKVFGTRFIKPPPEPEIK